VVAVSLGGEASVLTSIFWALGQVKVLLG
jgi:hypothetical protein